MLDEMGFWDRQYDYFLGIMHLGDALNLPLPERRSYLCRSDLSKLEYLTMCIKEGMRLHCPVAIVARKTTKELDIGDKILPEGTVVQVSQNFEYNYIIVGPIFLN